MTLFDQFPLGLINLRAKVNRSSLIGCKFLVPKNLVFQQNLTNLRDELLSHPSRVSQMNFYIVLLYDRKIFTMICIRLD